MDGSTSINAPMSRSGDELRTMVDYCRVRGIEKIVVDEMRDVADTPSAVAGILNYLQTNGMTLDVVHCEMEFGQKKDQEPMNMEFGGM